MSIKYWRIIHFQVWNTDAKLILLGIVPYVFLTWVDCVLSVQVNGINSVFFDLLLFKSLVVYCFCISILLIFWSWRWLNFVNMFCEILNVQFLSFFHWVQCHTYYTSQFFVLTGSLSIWILPTCSLIDKTYILNLVYLSITQLWNFKNWNGSYLMAKPETT